MGKDLEAKCVWKEMIKNPNSTSGQDMRDSIKRNGSNAEQLKRCMGCDGYDTKCLKYTPKPSC